MQFPELECHRLIGTGLRLGNSIAMRMALGVCDTVALGWPYKQLAH